MSTEAKQALEAALERFGADTGTLHRLGEDGLLHLEAWAGHIPDHLLPVIQTIPVGKGIAGLAVERKAPVDICNLQTDTSGQARPGAKSTGVQGSICVPMMRGDEAVGALGIATVQERIFTEAEIAELMALGRSLAAN
ncbi:MAG: GAF domain-containing protein [Bryobacterales bacterium]